MKFVMAGMLLTSSMAFAVEFKPQVIYGNDDRIEVSEVPNARVREVADSTLAMIGVSSLRPNDQGGFDVSGRPYGLANRLCSGERFYSQPTAASCSAFYLGGDLIATAGHCIQASTCGSNAFVFGYRMGNDGSAPTALPASEVYRCKAVVARELTREQDYAIVQLDRPVTGHTALRLAEGAPQVNDALMVIGHPAGLPAKVAPGAGVRALRNGFFVANLDTYGGNSGSAVFDFESLEVVGILVRGERDFMYDSENKCSVSKKCLDSECRGEDVTYISYVKEALKKSGLPQ